MSRTLSIRPSIGRREVVGAAAWSVPALAVVGAAPAFAASPDRQIRTSGRVTQTQTSGSTWYTRWRSATIDSAVPYPGVRLTNLLTTDRVTDISHTLWLRRSDANFQLESGATSNMWNTPVQDRTMVRNGVTYYGYTSTYTGPVPTPTNGVVYVRGANWQANYGSSVPWRSRSADYFVSVDAKVNGYPLSYMTDVIRFP